MVGVLENVDFELKVIGREVKSVKYILEKKISGIQQRIVLLICPEDLEVNLDVLP